MICNCVTCVYITPGWHKSEYQILAVYCANVSGSAMDNRIGGIKKCISNCAAKGITNKWNPNYAKAFSFYPK